MKTKITLDLDEIRKAVLTTGAFAIFMCISRYFIGIELTMISFASVTLAALLRMEQKN